MELRILIYHAEQCDPKKCTGIRLSRMKRGKILKTMKQIPRGAIVLNPVSETAFSPADRNIVIKSGLVGLDCSWKQNDSILSHLALAAAEPCRPGLISTRWPNSLGRYRSNQEQATGA
ncbi:MAG: ribosome biogenesis domain-containing protein [Candidatus Thorarchaeota archaeon]